MRIRLRKRPPWSKAAIYYGTYTDSKTRQEKPCIWLECTRGGTRIGPYVGQSRRAIEKGLSQLTLLCDCPPGRHKASYFYGQKTEDLAPEGGSGAK